MAIAKEVENRTAPYIPFSTFKNFIGLFSGDGASIPNRIDRSLMGHMSGGDQSALRGALRFFGLVDPDRNDETTDGFRHLVSAFGGTIWSSTLKGLLIEKYNPVLGGLELTTATPAQLNEAFRERGNVSGAGLIKAIRFYLTAVQEAGIVIPPHLVKRKAAVGTSSSRRNSVARSRKSKDEDIPSASVLNVPSEIRELRFTLPSGEAKVWMPANATDREIEKLAQYLKDFIELSTPPGTT